jgi:SWI/SNF-related matrix-associated actin-dependent regulator of chromatin subfamily A member 5
MVKGPLKKRLLSEKFDAVITTYEMTLIEQSTLKKIPWKYMVIDEAHRIKNENSQLSQIVRAVKAEYRLLLTGTPLQVSTGKLYLLNSQNNLHELWALLNFLVPSIFSSSDDWEEWFTVENKEAETEDEKKERGKEVIEKLHKLLKPFILRRRKAEVERGIPPKTEIKVYVRMSRKQKNWYRRVLEKDLSCINSGRLFLDATETFIRRWAQN